MWQRKFHCWTSYFVYQFLNLLEIAYTVVIHNKAQSLVNYKRCGHVEEGKVILCRAQPLVNEIQTIYYRLCMVMCKKVSYPAVI